MIVIAVFNNYSGEKKMIQGTEEILTPIFSHRKIYDDKLSFKIQGSENKTAETRFSLLL